MSGTFEVSILSVTEIHTLPGIWPSVFDTIGDLGVVFVAEQDDHVIRIEPPGLCQHFLQCHIVDVTLRIAVGNQAD